MGATRRRKSALLRATAAALMLLIGNAACAAILTTQIDGIDDALKPAVLGAAEITSYEKKDVTPAQAKRLYTNAAEQIGKALEAYGFYNAKTDGELKETPQGYAAIIHVRMGDPTKVATFVLDVPSPARDETLVAKALADFAPKAGAIFDQTGYEKSKAAVQSALFASGYLDANLMVHRAEVTRSTSRVSISLKWMTGSRYRFGAVHFRDSQFDAGFLDRYIPWHEGDFYSQNKLLQLQQKLIDADYFAIVDVMPNKDQAHDGVIPIEISLAPAKRNIYTAGVFVDSDVGVGVKGSVTRRWVNAHGHKLKVEAEIAQKEKSLSTTYTIPMPGQNNRSFNFGAIYNNIDTTNVQSRTFRFVANEQQQWLGFTRTLGINYLTGNFTVAAIDGSSSMLYPELTLSRKHADDTNFVRDGYSIILDARGSPGLASDTKFAQVRGDLKWIHALANNQRLILRGSLGVTSVDNFDDLPPELRFFAGGNNSIRGYAYQTVGPPLSPALVPIANANCARNSSLDCSNLIIGGKNLVVASAEYEYYFTPTWGIATFIDTGDSFNSLNSYQNRIGTGVGVRYRSPVGMIRADIGVPVNDPTGKTGVQLHLVIGPDL